MRLVCFIFVFILNISAFSQQTEIFREVRRAAELSYWDNPKILDRYNDWDVLKNRWVGLTVPTSDFSSQRQIGFIFIAPRGFSLSFGDWLNVPDYALDLPSGNLSKFQANEVVAQRAGIPILGSTSLVSENSYHRSMNINLLVNMLNGWQTSSIFGSKRIDEVKLTREEFSRNDSTSSVARSRQWKKLFSLSLGFQIRRTTLYNLYSNNGVSNEYLTPAGFLIGDLQNIIGFNPSFGFVFHPKFFLFDFSYIPNLGIFNTRVGITLPIKKRSNDY